MRGFGVVFTPPVAQKGTAIACKRNTYTLEVKEKNIVHPILMPATTKKIATTKTVGSLSNLLTGMESCVSFARLLI